MPFAQKNKLEGEAGGASILAEAQGESDDPAERAVAGEDGAQSSQGLDAVRLIANSDPVDPASRRALITAVRASAAPKVKAGTDAARSQDFLYDEDGYPE